MKNHLIFITLILLIFTKIAFSQSISQYGIKTGWVNAKITYKNTMDDEGFGRINGLLLSVFYEMSLIKNVFLLSQLEYIQKGTSHEYTIITVYGGNTGKKTYTNRIHYLHLPLMVKFILPCKKISPCIFAGPGLNYLLSYDEKFEFLFKDFKKFMPDASVGFGFRTGLFESFDSLFEFRYDFDLMNSYDKINQLTGKKIDIRNSSLNFIIGIYF